MSNRSTPAATHNILTYVLPEDQVTVNMEPTISMLGGSKWQESWKVVVAVVTR